MTGKKLYTLIAFILLAALYLLIFFFSAEDAENSSAVSLRVTKALVRAYYRLRGSTSQQVIVASAVGAEGFVRKLAHFTEYACVGFLSYSIVILWRGSTAKSFLTVVLQLFLSAALDEFHQYFVPGRYASFQDVLLDAVGGISGVLAFAAGRMIWRNCVQFLKFISRIISRR